TVTVTYNYIPDNCLDAGNYTIVQVTQPAGYADGKESRGGVVLNNPSGTDTIPVTLASADLTHNDFGELRPAGLSGYVYVDANNNGVKDGSESGISGTQVTLSGTDDLGPVSRTATTDSSGFYQFTNLRPGTYSINETQPSNYLDGKDTIGSQGGTAGNDQLSSIALASNVQGINNNFGELQPASLSGFAYADTNNNGVKDGGESAIPGVQITLSGTDDLGPVSRTATTD